MASYLLDTNHAGALVTIGHTVRQRVQDRMAAGDLFYITLPVITETVFGFKMTPRAVQNEREWALLRPSLRLIQLDEQDAVKAADLQASLRRRGWQLETVDALIAIAALRYDLTLLTTDGDFRRVPSLKIDNWRATQP